MTTITMTSELEAINTLLSAVGETGIHSLEVTGLADVAAAKRTLDEISREVQLVGWHFNTEEEYPLAPDTVGYLNTPPNALKVYISGDSSLVQRGSRLYDRTKHSFTFEASKKVTAVFLLPWDSLPQVARHYIMVRASRIFQARTLGSDSQFQFSKEEEDAALKALQESEGETGSFNIFNGTFVQSILSR